MSCQSRHTLLSRGFTLIELLIVIVIIGIMASFLIFTYPGIQKSARDTRRQNDLKQYQSALEIYASKNDGFYPSYGANPAVVISSSNLCTALATSACPSDAKAPSDSSYNYRYSANGTGSGSKTATRYVFWSKMERKSEYWVICSTGKVGTKAVTGWTNPTNGTCPI